MNLVNFRRQRLADEPPLQVRLDRRALEVRVDVGITLAPKRLADLVNAGRVVRQLEGALNDVLGLHDAPGIKFRCRHERAGTMERSFSRTAQFARASRRPRNRRRRIYSCCGCGRRSTSLADTWACLGRAAPPASRFPTHRPPSGTTPAPTTAAIRRSACRRGAWSTAARRW